MGKNQMENTAMQAQMQAELLRQIQSGGQKDSAASAQREVLLKLESKLSSLQDVQHRELAHIKALESMHRE